MDTTTTRHSSPSTYGWILTALCCVSYLYFIVNRTPCDSPTTYSIGRIDPQFKITRTELQDAITVAKKIWEKPAQKPLFTSTDQGKITINLIYDERQKTTEERKILEADSQKIKSLATDVKDQYFELEHELTEKKRIYQSELALYTSEQTDYNETVEKWNKQGGAPKNAYDELTAARASLNESYQDLEIKRQEINGLIDTINTFSEKYNLLVTDINKNISKINETAGKEFTEGLFDPNTKTINIYEFDSKNALIRVLAHELGHALTLDHTANESSIMYEVNRGATLSASPEDIMELKRVCKL